MAKRLTRYIILALVLGIIAGWAINSAIDDGTPASAAQLKSIADYLSIVTTLFLRLIKMIIAPLVFSTLVAGIAHMGDVAALGRVGVRSILLVHPRQPRVADARPDRRHAASSRASASTWRSRRQPRQRRRDRRLQPQGLRLAPGAAVDLRGDEHQRDPADRHLLDVLRHRADRRRREGPPIVRGVEALVA